MTFTNATGLRRLGVVMVFCFLVLAGALMLYEGRQTSFERPYGLISTENAQVATQIAPTPAAPITGAAVDSQRWHDKLDSIHSQVVGVALLENQYWQEYSNGTISADDFGNLSQPVVVQLTGLSNEVALQTPSAEWQPAYSYYHESLVSLVWGIQGEVAYSHTTFASLQTQASTLNQIEAWFNMAARDLTLSRMSSPAA